MGQDLVNFKWFNHQKMIVDKKTGKWCKFVLAGGESKL